MVTATATAAKSCWWRRSTLLLFGAAICLARMATAAPEAALSGPALRIVGVVQRELSFSLAELRAMPATEQRWEREAQPHRARGVDLMALIDRAGLKENPTVKNHRLRFAVVARGRDGYEVVFSLGELMPKLGGRSAVVAYEEDGRPLSERDAPLKLVVGGDQASSRWVRDLIQLRIVDLNSTGLPSGPNHLAP